LINDFFPADPDAVQPVVHEDERTLSMVFDMSAVQSRMRRADPVALELDYTRTMMGFLLVEPDPAAILMIGLGGGSLAKYCHKHLPSADITVVEINPHVIALRDAFFVPRDDARFRVVLGDGAAHVARSACRHDVLLVDGFNLVGQPDALCTPEFYRACRAALGARGVLVVNLHAEEPACSALIERIAAAFDGDIRVARADAGGNRIVFAGCSARLADCAAHFGERWAALPEVHKRTLRTSASRVARSAAWRAPAFSAMAG